MRLAGQIAGVSNLKFERNRMPAAARPSLSWTSNGRILGFFTWDKAVPATQALKRLAPLVSIVASSWLGLPAWRSGSSGVRATSLR